MLPDPLHPAVVHLPIALALLAPLWALLAFLAIRFRALPARAWLLVVLLQAAMLGSAWLAVETGEREEERVEEVVAERHIEAHEELAERLLVASGVTLVAAVGGLLPAAAGAIGRGLTLAATLAVLAMGIQTGHSGGELVYRHGAASAYVTEGGSERAKEEEEDEEEDEHRQSGAYRVGRHDDDDD